MGSNTVGGFRPHPPLRSYASDDSHLHPVRKKRQAPKPPVNTQVNDEIRPPLEKALSAPEYSQLSPGPPSSDPSQSSDVLSIEQPIESNEQPTMSMFQPMACQGTRDFEIQEVVSENNVKNNENCRHSSQTGIKEAKEDEVDSRQQGDNGQEEKNEVRLLQEVPGDGNLLQEIQEILAEHQEHIPVLSAAVDDDQDVSTSEQSNNEFPESNRHNRHRENVPDPSVGKDGMLEETKDPQKEQTVQEEISLTETQKNSQELLTKESCNSLFRNNEAEKQNNSEVTIKLNPYDCDVIGGHGKYSDDEIMKHVIPDTSAKEKKRHKNKKHGHRDNNENASSGYSSPGSADEGVTSPEPVTSLMSSLPSPTSSYYSSSLSTSSSRVSDMSRELTLMTSCKCNDVKEQITSIEQTNKPTNKQSADDGQQRHRATDINMNDVPTRRRSTSTYPSRGIDENALITDRIRAGTVTESSSVPSDVPLASKPENIVKLREKQVPKIRPKSEFIPYSSNRNEWLNQPGRYVSKIIHSQIYRFICVSDFIFTLFRHDIILL